MGDGLWHCYSIIISSTSTGSTGTFDDLERYLFSRRPEAHGSAMEDGHATCDMPICAGQEEHQFGTQQWIQTAFQVAGA